MGGQLPREHCVANQHDHRHQNRLPTGANPREVAFDGANIWVVNRNGISVTKINPATGATIGTFATGNIPNGLAFDGTSIWIANFGSDIVSKIDHEVLESTLSQPRPRRRTS